MADDSGGFELVTGPAKTAKPAPKKVERTLNPLDVDWSDPFGLGPKRTLNPLKTDWRDPLGVGPSPESYTPPAPIPAGQKPKGKAKRNWTLNPLEADWSLGGTDASGFSLADIPRQTQAQVVGALSDLGHMAKHPLQAAAESFNPVQNPMGVAELAFPGGPMGMRALNDALGVPGALIGGPVTSVLGRPVEMATRGKVTKEQAAQAILLASGGVEAVRGGALEPGGILGKPDHTQRLKAFNQPRPGEEPAAAEPQTQLQKNVADLKAAGIKPSLAAAAAKKSTQGLTRVLAPSVVGHPIRAAIRRTVGGLKDSAAQTAENIGDVKSAAGAGEGLKEGVERFSQPTPGARAVREELTPAARDAVESAARSTPSRKLGFGNKADILYERAERLVGRPWASVEMPNLEEALGEAQAKFSDPNLGEQFGHPEIARLAQTIRQNAGRMTWSDARAIRTTIREQLKSEPGLRAKVSEAEVNRIYNGLTKDLEAGAEQLGGPDAGAAYKEANAYYAAGQGRIANALQRVFNADSGDQVFEMMLKDGRAGAARNLERLNQVRKSVSPDEWRDFAASTLAHMGLAKPGEIGAEGEFSFKTFLDNMNRLDTRVGSRDASGVDSGLKLLFDGVGDKGTYEKVRAMARSAELMRDLHQFSRGALSGEHGGSHLVNRGLMAGGGVALFSHNPLAAVLTAMPPALTAWALESPKFVDLIAKLPEKGSPADVQGFLTKAAALSKGDPHASAAVAAMAASLAPALAAKATPPEDKPKPATDSKDEFPEDKFELVGEDPHDGHPAGEHPMFWQDDPQGFIASYVGAPVVITSGYRTKEKQEALLEAWERGGRKGIRPAAPGASAHNRGQAFDFKVPGMSNEQVMETLEESGVPFDQLINEGNHIHISFAPALRGEIIGGGHTTTPQGDPGTFEDPTLDPGPATIDMPADDDGDEQ